MTGVAPTPSSATVMIVIPSQVFFDLLLAVARIEPHADVLRAGRQTSLHLSPRELEVMRCIAVGRANKEIACELHISQKTVETHVTHILEKLDVPSRTAIAAYAFRSGIV